MGAIKREPTPSGPVTDLFDRLHVIHLAAGQPSMREIADRIGRGVVSSSTVHNMFRGPRVPKWGFLELVVEDLDGDIAEFRELWQAARLAEEAADNPEDDGCGGQRRVSGCPAGVGCARPAVRCSTAPTGAAGDRAATAGYGPTRFRSGTRTSPAGLTNWRHCAPTSPGHDRPHPAAQLISGMGGVGKTEIATEYIHQHRHKYEIIWWIRAEQTDRVRDALVSWANGWRYGPRARRAAATGRSRRSSTLWQTEAGRTGS